MKVLILTVVALVLVGVPASADESLAPERMLEILESKCLKHAKQPLHLRSMAQIENWTPFDTELTQTLEIMQGRGWFIPEEPKVSLLLFGGGEVYRNGGCALWFPGEGYEDYETAIERALDVRTLSRTAMPKGGWSTRWRLDYGDSMGVLQLMEMGAPIIATNKATFTIEYNWIE